MKVGDILVYTHNYNCRRPVFVRIIRATKASIWVEKLQNCQASGDWMMGTVVPSLTTETTPVKGSFRIKSNSYWPEYVKIDGCITTPWNGEPEDSYCD